MQTNMTSAPAKKLLDQMRDKIRFKHYSLSMENICVSWIKQYILFNGKRYPAEMGAAEGEVFLTYLATGRHVSSSTQNQALSTILFLYRGVLALYPYLRVIRRIAPPIMLLQRPLHVLAHQR